MLQEDAERAEKEADQDDSGPDGSPKSSSSSGSSKSSFGVADQDSDEEAAKKPKRRSVGSAKAKPAPKGKSQPTKKGQKEKQELAKNLDVAEKYLASLQELKFHTLWKSVVRGPEIDRRLSRESTVLNSVEASMGACSDPELTATGSKLCADINYQAKAVYNMRECCKIIRGAQVQELMNEVTTTGGSLAPMLSFNDFDLGKRLAADVNTLVDILLVTAKKLLEVPWLPWCDHCDFRLTYTLHRL